MVDGGGETKFTFDNAGRLATVTTPDLKTLTDWLRRRRQCLERDRLPWACDHSDL